PLVRVLRSRLGHLGLHGAVGEEGLLPVLRPDRYAAGRLPASLGRAQRAAGDGRRRHQSGAAPKAIVDTIIDALIAAAQAAATTSLMMRWWMALAGVL